MSTEIVIDPSTGRPILVAPGRSKRPLRTVANHSHGTCPFCKGEESQTPPTTDSLGEPWTVRSFDNLFKATDLHEVIVEGSSHVTQPGKVDEATLRDALQIYRRRILHFEAQDSIHFAFWIKNVGRQAGASIEHNHSQLFGLPMLPPRLEQELKHSETGCHICSELDQAEAEGRVITRGDQHIWLTPRAPKMPYETWIVPSSHEADYFDCTHDHDLAAIMHQAYASLDRNLEQPPFNVWLHRVPDRPFHWHYELQPRTGFQAGMELGGDMYINAVTPAMCVERLSK